MPLVGVRDHERRLAGPERDRGQHVQQFAVVVAVDLDDREAEGGGLLVQRVQVVGLAYGGALLEPVAVDDDGEPVQFVLGGGHHRLPVAALLQFAVADEHVRAAPGDVELGRQGMAHGDGQAVAQRSGVGLDAADLRAVGVAVERRQGLEEGGQFLDRQEAEGGERGVEDAGDVALGQDEAVAVRVVDGVRGDVEHRPVQGGENVHCGQIAADVPRVGVVHQLQILDPDLPRRLGDVLHLVRPRCVRVQPAEHRHGDVLDGQRGHASAAIEASSTCWTSRWAARAS
jgi:hypothetical protein